MIYRLLADLTFLAHFCFVIFTIFGGLLVLRRRFVLWLHLPTVFWGILIEFFSVTCPLTTLENYFLQLGGEAGYESGFIEHYVSTIIYWQMSSKTQILLGASLIIFNLVIYILVFKGVRLPSQKSINIF
jgi:hypothetical protein